MTAERPREPVRAEDDPLLDWHSDARRIMDEYANELAYSQIFGTQVELLRQAAETSPHGLSLKDATVYFDEHVALARAAHTGKDVVGSVEGFVAFLVKRVMLRSGGDGRLVLTSVGLDFLRYMSDRDLPNPPL